MKKSALFLLIIFITFALTSCGVSNKKLMRYEQLEENVENPTTIEQLKAAIEKYGEKAADVQLATSQIGIWNKILGTRYIDEGIKFLNSKEKEYEKALDSFSKALKCFEEALKIYPLNENLYYYVGVCGGYMSCAAMDFSGAVNHEVKYNYLKLAEEGYLRAIELDDRYVRALYGIGVLYVFELEEPEKAIPHLEKLLTIDKKNLDAMFVLARAYYSTYNFDKSIAMYDKIIATTKAEETKATAEANKKIVLDAAYSN